MKTKLIIFLTLLISPFTIQAFDELCPECLSIGRTNVCKKYEGLYRRNGDSYVQNYICENGTNWHHNIWNEIQIDREIIRWSASYRFPIVQQTYLFGIKLWTSTDWRWCSTNSNNVITNIYSKMSNKKTDTSSTSTNNNIFCTNSITADKMISFNYANILEFYGESYDSPWMIVNPGRKNILYNPTNTCVMIMQGWKPIVTKTNGMYKITFKK